MLPDQSTQPLCLLIVDDDVALRQALVWSFEELGYRVTAAANYQEALVLITDSTLDCALLDYHLPDGNGQQLLKQMRQTQPRLPIILMSGNRTEQMAEVARGSGVLTVLTKPISIDWLDHFYKASIVPSQVA